MKNFLKIPYIFLKNKIEKNLDKRNAKKRIKFKKIYEKFNSIKIDTTGYASDLCILGEKYGTDKSIYNKKTKHQHSYTAVYNILFNHLKNKIINIAEIGIAHSSSLQMFRDYFKYSNIYAFDHDKTTIENSKKININNVNYFQLDVKDRIEIQRLFKKINIFYDIIIDDSSHLFDHQINIILEAKNFLKENGILVIEDIYLKEKGYSEELYYKNLSYLKKEFSDIFFCTCEHEYNYSGFWNNCKLLVLIK
jgi:hypothetical protein